MPKEKIVIQQEVSNEITIYKFTNSTIKMVYLDIPCYVNISSIPAVCSALCKLGAQEDESVSAAVSIWGKMEVYQSMGLLPEQAAKEILKDFIVLRKPQ